MWKDRVKYPLAVRPSFWCPTIFGPDPKLGQCSNNRSCRGIVRNFIANREHAALAKRVSVLAEHPWEDTESFSYHQHYLDGVREAKTAARPSIERQADWFKTGQVTTLHRQDIPIASCAGGVKKGDRDIFQPSAHCCSYPLSLTSLNFWIL